MSSFLPGFGTLETSLTSATTLSALSIVETNNLQDGAIIFVKDINDIYYLELNDNLTPDGYNVISAKRGGYWVSITEGRWDDQQGDISQGVGSAILTYEAFKNTPWNLYCMRHDQNDTLNFRFQFSHSWRYNTSVYPHLHIVPLADPISTQVAYFDAYYTWTKPGYFAIPDIDGWTWAKIQVPINPGDIDIQTYVNIGPVIPPSWARESSILLLMVRRLGTDPIDTYTTNKGYGLPAANIGLLSADVHFRKKDSGSLSQIPNE